MFHKGTAKKASYFLQPPLSFSHTKFVTFASVLLTLTGFGMSPAYALEADPSLIERNFEETNQQRNAVEPKDAGVQQRQKDASTAVAETAPFTLTAVRLTGATVIDGATIAPAYEEFLAAEISDKELQLIVDRVTALYRDAGYSLSYATLPPQEITTGVVHLQIIEGAVEGVALSGVADIDRYQNYFAGVQSEKPLRQRTLERAILLLNDLSGLTVTDITLDERTDRPGAYQLGLVLARKTIAFSSYLDNRGTRSVGRIQLGLTGIVNDVLGADEQVSASYFTVPASPQELQYLRLGYTQPMGKDGLLLQTSGSYSMVDAGGNLGLVNTESDGVFLQAGLRYPLLRTRPRSAWLGLSFDYRRSMEENNTGPTFEDTLSVLRGRLDYSADDNWGGQNFATAEVSQGLSILNASRPGDTVLSRADGEGQFTKAHVTLYRYQQLVGDALGLILQASGQKSSAPLLSAEEFSLGGARFGRAYEYSELTGDSGVAGSAELAYRPDLGWSFPTFVALYTFYDIGAVWNRNTVGDARRQSLASAGGGLRFGITENWSASVEVGQPLTRIAKRSGDQDPQIFFSLSSSY